MKTCKICGCSFDEENFEGVVVNEGIDNEYHVCCDCVPSECNNGHIISCEACGSYFSADKLHDEEIEGHSFTACPACGKDVVEGLSLKMNTFARDILLSFVNSAVQFVDIS